VATVVAVAAAELALPLQTEPLLPLLPDELPDVLSPL